MEKLKVYLQYCIPQHGLSRLVGFLASTRNPLISQLFIRIFAKAFGITLDEAQKDKFNQFASFNDFFTRALQPEARPIAEGDNTLVCPADGTVSQQGLVDDGQIVQAKGHDYSIRDLLGGDHQDAEQFDGGHFTTVYLSPKDYHRLHMPCTGKLTKMVYVPGALFSVNPATVRNVPNLFARNERVVCFFDTEFGPMALVLVGATIVASIETVWSGVVTPPTGPSVFTWHYKDEEAITLQKGEEMGRFKLGSTIICVFPKDGIEFDESYVNDTVVQMGQQVGQIK